MPVQSRRDYLSVLGAGSYTTFTASRAKGDDSPTAASSDDVKRSAQPTDGWPRPEFDTRGTAFNPDATGPDDPIETNWTRTLGPNPVRSLVVSDGVVYASDAEAVHAVDARTGVVRWQRPSEVGTGLDVRAAVDGTVVTTSSHGVQAHPVEGGSPRWTMTGTGAVLAVTRDTVYAGKDASLVGYDVRTGRVRWTSDPLDGAERLLDVAIRLGTAFVVATSGGSFNVLYAVDLDTGDVRWRTTRDSGAGAPTVTGEAFVVGTTFGRTVRLDTVTGKKDWEFDGERRVVSTGYGNDRVFSTTVGPQGTTIRGVDVQTGEVAWSHETSPVSPATGYRPVAGAGAAYVWDDGIAALDPSDGTVRWHLTEGVDNPGPLAVADDTLYGADGSTVFAIN